MGLYNFHKRFVPMIEAGAKTHTIRATRKHADKPGNVLHLYTGLRQKGGKLIKRATCTLVQDITITAAGSVIIDEQVLDAGEREALAKSDGFADFAEMLEFWDGRRPFVGQVIHWS